MYTGTPYSSLAQYQSCTQIETRAKYTVLINLPNLYFPINHSKHYRIPVVNGLLDVFQFVGWRDLAMLGGQLYLLP